MPRPSRTDAVHVLRGLARVATLASLLLFAATFGAGEAAAEPRSVAEAPRTFFLALDAVPYTAVAALHASGDAPELFAELGSPVPLISTFPSTTTVAMGAALGPLGLEVSPGYEARFFDWSDGEIRGGGPISFFKIQFPWRTFFDWSKKSVARSALASLRPAAASVGRALSAFEAFRSSRRRDFFAYIETTGSAAHLRGPASLDRMFRAFGLAVRDARSAGEEFRVVVFSDHGISGGRPLRNVLPDVVEALARSGYRRVKKLGGERGIENDVVLTPYGLVSSFEAYARDADVPDLAAVLVSAEGVDLCAYRSAGELRVVSEGGLATIGRKEERWAYLPKTGDPLGYREVLDRLRIGASGAAEADWFSDLAWFEATRNERYPDALRRIARGFELVHNPASIICSLEPGHMYGPRKTEMAARLTGGRLRWTHGALTWEASAGFLLTDVRGSSSTEAVRLAEALRPLTSSAARVSASGREDTEETRKFDAVSGRGGPEARHSI